MTDKLQIDNAAPGIFLKETDIVDKNIFLVLDSSIFLVQERDDAFAFVASVLAIDPTGSTTLKFNAINTLTTESDGVAVIGQIALTVDPTAGDRVGDRDFNDARYTQLSLVKDDIGTYIIARNVSGGTVNSNATVAGSSLDDTKFDSAGLLTPIGASAPAGTWRNMGQSNLDNEFGIYKRVS